MRTAKKMVARLQTGGLSGYGASDGSASLEKTDSATQPQLAVKRGRSKTHTNVRLGLFT